MKKFIALIVLTCCLLFGNGSISNPEIYQPASNGVNKYTGQYNFSIPAVSIPGPNGSGYTINLAYSSGAKPDDEASWVGFGWNLGAGKIIRQKKGLPDDYHNADVKYWQKFRPQTIITEIDKLNLEFDGVDFSQGLSLNAFSVYDNLSGYNKSFSPSINISIGDASTNLTGNWDVKGNYSVDFNPLKNFLSSYLISSIGGDDFSKFVVKTFIDHGLMNIGQAIEGSFSGNSIDVFPSSALQYQIENMTILANLSISKNPILTSLEMDITSTNSNIRKPITIQPISRNTFGYIYSGDIQSDSDVMDYYVEKEALIDTRDKYISIPFANKDIFYISDGSVSGKFKAYSSKVGSFRPNKVINRGESKVRGVTLGPILETPGLKFGLDIGHGINYLDYVGVFNHNTRKNNWYSFIESDKTLFSRVPSFSFRMTNDLGHYSSQLDGLNLISPNYAKVTDNHEIQKNGSILESEYSASQGLNQSTVIEYNTVEDLLNDVNNVKSFRKFRNWAFNVNLRHLNPKTIIEYKVTSPNGVVQVYGMPVFSKNEKNLSYNINKIYNGNNFSTNSEGTPNLILPYTKDNKRVFGQYELGGNMEPQVVLGQEMNEPYANSYLLTEIYQPDYIDLKNDGPTSDDIGGYTLFEYERTAGTNNKNAVNEDWYKWRVPYTGFNYNRGSQSDPFDDMISFASGEKELYYLKSIATKSHVAFFVTNNSTINYYDVLAESSESIIGPEADRLDEHEANHSELDAGKGVGFEGNTSNINHKRFLDRIELWTLDQDDPFDIISSATSNGERKYRVVKKISTTQFGYDKDYPIWQDHPSSAKMTDEFNYGKLTLKQVWVENGDEISNHHSPYKFEYSLDNRFISSGQESAYPDNMPDLVFGDEADQKPHYNYMDIDHWGNYKPNKINNEKRFENNKYWSSQKNSHYEDVDITNTSVFNSKLKTKGVYDPAAWNLKSITSPNKKITHIGYEENEFSYVQNKDAMVFTNIKKYDPSQKAIWINLDDHFDNINSAKLNEFRSVAEALFLDSNEFIYFNFLYKFTDNTSEYDELASFNNEWISGYCKVEDCTIDNGLLKISLESLPDNKFIPTELCRQFYMFKRYKNINYRNSANPLWEKGRTVSIYDYNTQFKRLGDDIDVVNYDSWDNYCKVLFVEQSYVKIPLPKSIPKKGGGVRVSKIYNIDEFLMELRDVGTYDRPYNYNQQDKLDVRIYGVQYEYVDKNDFSSGVATNEPIGFNRNENALVSYSDKRKLTTSNGITKYDNNILSRSFDELKQYEFPIGETILPSPQVTYSSVYEKSIFNTETHPGIVQNEYYTYKDFPLTKMREVAKNTSENLFNSGVLYSPFMYDNKKYSPINVDEGENDVFTQIQKFQLKDLLDPDFYNLIINNVPTLSQIRNARYNVEKGELTLSQAFTFLKDNKVGKSRKVSYYGGNLDLPKSDLSLSKSTEYDYYELGETIPIMEDNLIIYNKYLGVSSEITMEDRYVRNFRKSLLVDSDASIIFQPPYLVKASQFNSKNLYETKTKMNSISKIVEFPAVIKSVTNVQDGVSSKTEFTAFDKLTGRPVVNMIESGYADYSESEKQIKKVENISLPMWFDKPEFEQSAKSLNSMFSIGYNNDYNKHLIGLHRKKMNLNVDGTQEDIYLITFDRWFYTGSSNLKKQILPGAIIRVKPNGILSLTSEYDEFYRVLYSTNNHLTVIPLKDEIYDNIDYSTIPYSTIPCDVEVVFDGRKNQLNNTLATVTRATKTNSSQKGNVHSIQSLSKDNSSAANYLPIVQSKKMIVDELNDEFGDFINLLASNQDPLVNNYVDLNAMSSVKTGVAPNDAQGGAYFFDLDGINFGSNPIPKIHDVRGEEIEFDPDDYSNYDKKIWISSVQYGEPALTPWGVFNWHLNEAEKEYLTTQFNDNSYLTGEVRNDYTVVSFDLNLERVPQVSGINTNTSYHPIASQINSVMDNTWGLDITEILQKQEIYPEKQLGENNIYLGHISQSTHLISLLGLGGIGSTVDFANSQKVRNVWEEINLKTGMIDLLGSTYLVYNSSTNIEKRVGDFLEVNPNLSFNYITIRNADGEVKTFIKNFELNEKGGSGIIGFERDISNNNNLWSYTLNLDGGFSSKPYKTNTSESVLAAYIDKTFKTGGSDKFSNKLEVYCYNNKLRVKSLINTWNSHKYLSNQLLYPSQIPDDILTIRCSFTAEEDDNNYPDNPQVSYSPFALIDGNIKFENGTIDLIPYITSGATGAYGSLSNPATVVYIKQPWSGEGQESILFDFYPNDNKIYTFDSVLSASTYQLSNNWNRDNESWSFGEMNADDPYRSGELGLWSMKKSLVYDNSRRFNHHNNFLDATITENTILESPIFNYPKAGGEPADLRIGNQNKFVLYNDTHTELNDENKWKWTSEIIEKDKNNIPTDIRNRLGINSSLKIDKHNRISMVAQRAKSSQIIFNSFEKYGNNTELTHTGNSSLYLNKPGSQTQDVTYTLGDIYLNNLENDKYIIQFWSSEFVPPNYFNIRDENGNNLSQTSDISITQNGNSIEVNGWYLQNYLVTLNSNINGNYDLTYTDHGLATDIMPGPYFIDDFKFAPKDAITQSYVYDLNDGKILAVFDNDHFSNKYIYGEDLALIQEISETFKGNKNLYEIYNHIPKKLVEKDYPEANESSQISSLPTTGKLDRIEFNPSKYRVKNTYDELLNYKSVADSSGNIGGKVEFIDFQLDKNGFKVNSILDLIKDDNIDSLSIEKKLNSIDKIQLDSIKLLKNRDYFKDSEYIKRLRNISAKDSLINTNGVLKND